MTDLEVKKLLATLFAAFPVETRNVPPEEALATAKVYERGIRDLDAAQAAQAIDRLIKSAERLPAVAKIRSVCVEIAHGRKRPGGDAWGDVVKAMRRYGYMRRPGTDFTFADPLVARAVDAMSWSELCASENSVADRARFIELYQSLDDNERRDAQIAPGARSGILPAGGTPREGLHDGPAAAKSIERTGEPVTLGEALRLVDGGE